MLDEQSMEAHKMALKRLRKAKSNKMLSFALVVAGKDSRIIVDKRVKQSEIMVIKKSINGKKIVQGKCFRDNGTATFCTDAKPTGLDKILKRISKEAKVGLGKLQFKPIPKP